MTGWELDELDFTEELEKTRKCRKSKIDKLLQGYPLSAISENKSVFVLMRHFEVSYWKGKRSILNGKPDTKDFQWGLTVVTVDEYGGSSLNFYLPNRSYTGVRIKGEEVTIQFGKQSVLTNLTELHRKMDFANDASEKTLEKGFKSLINENYDQKKTKASESKKPAIESAVLGTLAFDEEQNVYETTYSYRKTSFPISITNASSKKLEAVIAFAEKQMARRFYEDILLKMEVKMIKLKNSTWLEEDDNGKEERPITPTQFRKRISIEHITFYEDCSSEIYCNDDDIFFGHTILIDVDKKGKFKNADLAG